MKCSSCGKEFGDGANCQNCGIDRVSGLGDYSGFFAPKSKGSVASIPVSQRQMMGNKICPFCQEIIPSDADYCPFCSKKQEETCPCCGHVYPANFPVCPKCGTNREQYFAAIRESQQRQDEAEFKWRQAEEKRIQQKKKKEQELQERCRVLDNSQLLFLRKYGKKWWKTEEGRTWLKTKEVEELWLKSRSWLKTRQGRKWLKSSDGRDFVVRNALYESYPKIWYDWLKTEEGEKWIITNNWIGSSEWKVWEAAFNEYWSSKAKKNKGLWVLIITIATISFVVSICRQSAHPELEWEWRIQWWWVLVLILVFVLRYLVKLIIRTIRMRRWRGLVMDKYNI